MADIFGIDVAQEVWQAVQDAGGLHVGSLSHRVPREEGVDGSVTQPAPTAHSFQGILEKRVTLINGTFIPTGVSILTILAASLDPYVEPEAQDTVVIDGESVTLLELLVRDPATAVYQFKVTSSGG